MQAWVGNLLFALAAVVLPLAVIGVNVVVGFGGILVTIGMVVWMGFALILLAPPFE